jgi:hypothetical protein
LVNAIQQLYKCQKVLFPSGMRHGWIGASNIWMYSGWIFTKGRGALACRQRN